MTEGKWIRFVEFGNTGKTKLFNVQNKEEKDGITQCIGIIKWYGPFRQYSFFPNPNTVYERQCLLDITKFIHHLMLQRKLTKDLNK